MPNLGEAWIVGGEGVSDVGWEVESRVLVVVVVVEGGERGERYPLWTWGVAVDAEVVAVLLLDLEELGWEISGIVVDCDGGGEGCVLLLASRGRLRIWTSSRQ